MKIINNLISWIKSWKFSDWFLAVILLYFLINKAPGLFEQHKLQGTKLNPILMGERFIPTPKAKSVLVFWASWCGPCTIELNRIQKAINEREITSNNIFAVNMGDEENLVNKVVTERKYTMPIVLDKNGALANKVNVQGTPTISFIDENGVIVWLSTGLSPTLIYRIKKFLNN